MEPLAEGITEVPLDAQIKCTEAKDNHVEYWQLGDFMTFCEQYITGTNGMLIDMRFLPRITEGEIRLFMLRDHPVHVVHKNQLLPRMPLAQLYSLALNTAMTNQKTGKSWYKTFKAAPSSNKPIRQL